MRSREPDISLMTSPCPKLSRLLAVYKDKVEFQSLQARLKALASTSPKPGELLALYHAAIPLIEQQLWADSVDATQLALYQSIFLEMEQLISEQQKDDRHHFVIVIPIADRPQHLTACLDSLLSLCQLYNYGGYEDNKFQKISVLVADDSQHEHNINSHKGIVAHYNQQGLETEYFGQQQQLDQLARLAEDEKLRLMQVLGDNDASAFYHKGASITRNIAYLRLNEISRSVDNMLCYFIDSDQEFKIKIKTSHADNDLYAINYFYQLDRIFSNTDVKVLTGKVVGDPPVSPAVMAGNFLEDVICFLSRMAQLDAGEACRFHNHQQKVDDASYHDMADLFGFKPSLDSYHYHCTLTGSHDHIQCFIDFSKKLGHFFDGEHPTRKSYFEHQDLFSTLLAARTIYTGNYVFKPTMLDYFIPFATLKLRMAGPVLGRIIKAELGDQFVSANLPMLHKRTVEDIGQSEFRPGIHRQANSVDLSAEFERQYFGDVMLFTVIELTALGYPVETLAEALIKETLLRIETKLHQQYTAKHEQIMAKLATLKALFNDADHWWNQHPALSSASGHFVAFIDNIQHNFGAKAHAYELISSSSHRQARLDNILQAIMGYTENRCHWHQLLAEMA